MSLLSVSTTEAITTLRQHSPTAQSALLTALRLTQAERGRVGPVEVEEVARLLDLTPATVDGVARFYDQISRAPTGRHVVALCRGIACYIRGSELAQAELADLLHIGPDETTGDGLVTFRLVECVGDCDHAPAVMVDDTFLGAFPGERVTAALTEAKEAR